MKNNYFKASSLLGLMFLTQTIFGQCCAYYIGHSLINLNTPFIVKELRTAAGQSTLFRNHINIGAPLTLQWSAPENFNPNPIWDPIAGTDVEHGTNFMTALGAGSSPVFSSLVITESVPLLEMPVDTTAKYGKYFFDVAKNHNPTIKSFMLQTWEHVTDNNWTAWRASITSLLPNWEERVTKINTPSSSNNMYIIPAGLALGALYDTLALHPVGSMTHISQLFSDDIHMNDNGNYFVSCVMYAALYSSSPVGLPSVKAGPYTENMAVLDPILRAKMQEIALKVVQMYPRSGFETILATSDILCFRGKAIKNDNLLEYCLTENSSPQALYLEKSTDGIHFTAIAKLEAKPGDELNYIDGDVQDFVTYYRINMTDLMENHSKYSPMISIYNKQYLPTPTIMPNPVVNMAYVKNYTATQAKLINSLGKTIDSFIYTQNLDFSDLSPGVYIIVFPNGEKPIRVLKI